MPNLNKQIFKFCKLWISSLRPTKMRIMKTHTLQKEIETFERLKPTLIAHHKGKFVIIYKGKLEGAFDTFDNAAKEAIKRFGKGPYLIRRVEDDYPFALPASVVFRPIYASN